MDFMNTKNSSRFRRLHIDDVALMLTVGLCFLPALLSVPAIVGMGLLTTAPLRLFVSQFHRYA